MSWPVPNYTAWWQKHVYANNLPKIFAWTWNGWVLHPRPQCQNQRWHIVLSCPGLSHPWYESWSHHRKSFSKLFCHPLLISHAVSTGTNPGILFWYEQWAVFVCALFISSFIYMQIFTLWFKPLQHHARLKYLQTWPSVRFMNAITYGLTA